VLNAGGLLILVAGLGGALWIWQAQEAADRREAAAQAANPGAPLSPLDSRRYVRDVEINYGKIGVLAEELSHGKGLAKVIGVASGLAAAGLWLTAARLRP
jgi:hypothetical protein